MLTKPRYAADWEWKRQWYLDNGFVEGETLFTTRVAEKGVWGAKTRSCLQIRRFWERGLSFRTPQGSRSP